MKFSADISPTRREFIQQMSLLGMASMLPLSFWSCSKNTTDIDYQGSGLAPYKVWEEMLMAVKTSPDYLEGRMQQLINSKNPEAMLAFVRDEIFLIPPVKNSLRGMGKIMITGIPAVLRSGFATPREKAELLNSMLNHAGFNSKVVYERTDFQPDQVMKFFFRPIERKFEPKINQSILNRWKEEIQAEHITENQIILDPNETESKELSEHLYKFLPEDKLKRPHSFDFRWDNYRTPCVQLKNEDNYRYLHLFDATVPFGSLKEGENGKTSEPEEIEYTNHNIKLTLKVGSGDLQQHQILEGEWSFQELVGNQLLLHFGNGLTFTQQMNTAIGSLNTFTPSIALQSYALDAAGMSEKSVVGKTITLQGDLIETSTDTIVINGNPIIQSSQPDLQQQVSQLNIQAQPGNAPFLKILVTPLNQEGLPVEQLSAADFKFTINNQRVSCIMRNNVKTPKVIVLYDVSLSMPGEYSGDNMDAFVEQLEAEILRRYPAANIQKWKTPSELFTWLHKASRTSADLIIYATDGDNKDQFNEEWLNTYQNGAPAMILNVKNQTRYVTETFNKMAEITNGTVIMAKDQEFAQEQIIDYLSELTIAPYEFTAYVTDPQTENQVTVAMDNERVKASTTFKFKLTPKDINPLGTELSGVYLEITYDNKTTLKTLAGYDPDLHQHRTPNQADFLDVRSLLLGNVLIGVESQGATFANRLADLLQYKLSSRNWGESLLKNDVKEALNQYENGVYYYNDRLASLLQPLKNQVTQRFLTIATGPRIGILNNKVAIDGLQSSINFDYVHTSQFLTLAEDPNEALKITMQKTAQMALLENALFEETTVKLLKNKQLTENLDIRNHKDFIKKVDPLSQNFLNKKLNDRSGAFKIFDQNLDSYAYWHVNQFTGEVYGMLENNTAGGVERIHQQLNEILKVMDAYLLLLGVMSAKSGIPLAIVGGYGKTLVKLYALASEAIVVMDTRGLDENIKAVLAELACETYKTIVLGLYGNAGTVMSGMEYLINLMTGKSFCSIR